MNLLNKLTITNLKLNKKRTIVTIIGIMLSVALITAVASIFSSLIKTGTNFEISNQGNYHVAYHNVSKDDLETFKNNRKIETINITQNIGYAKIDSKNKDKPYTNLKSFTKNSLNNLAIRLVDGKLPENDDEILIPTNLKTEGRLVLNVGDTITLNVGQRADSEGNLLDQQSKYQLSNTDKKENIENEKIINAKTKTYKIVGITKRLPDSLTESNHSFTFITYLDDKNLNGEFDLYTRYTKDGEKEWAKTTANILGIEDPELFDKIILAKEQKPCEEEILKLNSEIVKAKYKLNPEKDIHSRLITLETKPLTGPDMSRMSSVIAIIIGIIVITSVFSIKNSFDISITEKIKQYGMLRSIGATKKQVKRNVFYEASILGAIGIPLGILLGIIASYILIIVMKSLTIGDNTEVRFMFSFIPIVAAIILGIITIYFSAFRSARKASKISPIDSIRNSANIKINPKKIKSPRFIKKMFGIGGEISFKNLKRNKKKYRTTVISIVVSVFTFIALSSFMNNVFDYSKETLNMSDNNIQLSMNVVDGDKDKKMFNKCLETTKLDNIENYTISRYAYFEGEDDRKYNPEYLEYLNGENPDPQHGGTKKAYFHILTLGKEQYDKYIKSLGLEYNKIKDKAILMDYERAYKYGPQKSEKEYKTIKVDNYQTGETLKGKAGDKDKFSFSVEIGHITDVHPFGTEEISPFLVISDELYDKAIAPNKINSSIQVRYKSSNPDKLQDDIDTLLKEEVYSLYNSEEYARETNNAFLLISIFLYGFIAVISLIGITNIFNTITTNMELRKQEFAMLKSIGMTTKEFNRMIRLETLFMGVKSLLFGLPIGIALSYRIHTVMPLSKIGIPYKLPITAILISIGIVFALISLIMKYSMSKISKQNTIETIRNENI